jgi:hypothetical protein
MVMIRIVNNTQKTILGVSVVLALLAITSVCLRFYAGKFKKNLMKADDWCIFVAFVRPFHENLEGSNPVEQ